MKVSEQKSLGFKARGFFMGRIFLHKIKRLWYNEDMKRHIRKVFGGVMMLGVAGLGVMNGGTGASALNFESSVGVNFVVNESITVTVPTGGLVISDLVPGTVADSNVIAVNVKCNSAYGYTLNATVGSATYNTRNLVAKDATVSEAFSSVDYGANLSALTTTKTWGYAASADGTSFSSYSGLPLYSDTANVATLRATTSGPTTSAGEATSFKIAAYAAEAMPLGEYNNVINFTAVANEPPVKYMQTVATWKDTVSDGEVVEAVDQRDNKTYYVAKLADGNLWMTQNLDFNIDATKTYTSADTDISADWTPSTSTYATGDATWKRSYTTPESYDPGDKCWTGLIDTSWSGTLDNASYATSCSEEGANMHYNVGNYYNWTAAVAMNDSSAYTTDNADVDQSICSAGWTLPKGGTTLTGTGSFYYMINQTGFTSGTGGNIHQTPGFLVYGGYWVGSSRYVGSGGLYWSSVVVGSGGAYGLHFYAGSNLSPQVSGSRDFGLSVRCVAR